MSQSSLVQRVFYTIPETALSIGGLNLLRPISPGSNWHRIRIGILCALNANATVTAGSMFFGLSTSYGRGVGAVSTGKFVGVQLLNGGNFTFTASALNPYFGGSGNVACYVKHDQSVIFSTGASAALFLAQAGGGQRLRRTPIFVDITRNVSNTGGTVIAYGCSSATVIYDYRPDHFFAGLDTWTTPVCNGQTMTVLATSTAVGVHENVGPLDTFDFFWSRSNAPVEIYAMGASVFLNKPVGYQATPFTGGYESFDSYGTGSNCAGMPPDPFLGTVLTGNATSPWTAGTLIGYSDTPMVTFPAAFSGTTGVWPVEALRFYGTGTALSDVTLNQGQRWTTNGTVLASW